MGEGQERQWIEGTLSTMLLYAIAHDFCGSDPYDGLNSRWIPEWVRGIPQLGWLHLCKRTPAPLRPLLRIPPSHNPKGTALFVKALVAMDRQVCDSVLPSRRTEVLDRLAERLSGSAQRDGTITAWGYPFPWRSRSFFVQRHAPNAVCSIFCADACLDLAAVLGREDLSRLARGVGRFLMRRCMVRHDGDLLLDYVPGTRVLVVNVWALGAALLLRLANAAEGNATEYREVAQQLIEGVGRAQATDGTWPYGLARNQRFVDGYHTGFVLEALQRCVELDGSLEPLVAPMISSGYEPYWQRLVGSNGAAYAGVGSRWPVDVHAAAQALLTAVAFTGRDDRARDRAARVLGWWRRFGMRADGLPRYQVGRNFNNNSVHLRWGVGWLTLALARYGIAFG